MSNNAADVFLRREESDGPSPSSSSRADDRRCTGTTSTVVTRRAPLGE
jgi:hypothetical protein